MDVVYFLAGIVVGAALFARLVEWSERRWGVGVKDGARW